MRTLVYVSIVSAAFLPGMVQADEPTIIVKQLSQFELGQDFIAPTYGLAPRTRKSYFLGGETVK